MLESFDVHEPLLINSIGHSAGLLLFAVFLVLVLRDRRSGSEGQRYLPAITAGLALLWNAGSLAGLAAASGLIPGSDLIAALSFGILSFLPAVLLQLSLEGEVHWIWVTGYTISTVALGLHLAELVTPDPGFHQGALWVVIVGFGILSIVAMFRAPKPLPSGRYSGGRRIPVSMALLLLAVSFVHFSPGHARSAWSSEIALHHAGIPLALYVLLQDYRFLLLDAFFRFLVNSTVACGFVLLSLALNAKYRILEHAGDNPFLQGVLLIAACLALIALALVRGRLQLLLTRVVFRRPDREPAIKAIRAAGSKAAGEESFLESIAPILAGFMGTDQCEIDPIDACREHGLPMEPALVGEAGLGTAPTGPSRSWAEVCVPLRFIKGDGALIFLGRREGGRRYLSEDLQELTRLAAVVVEQVERFRSSEVQRLVSQAELRALQSQINPHFLFNCLNTLYGTIPREAAEARRMVLNLAELFRYFLQSDRTFIHLSEEMQIVRAYLEIEALRLGDRLKTEILVDKSAEQSFIPVLSIQPLVENAVKHGIAVRSAPGTVRLRARATPDGVRVEVSDDGEGFLTIDSRKTSNGGGVGLDNVRRRLKLCFGELAELKIESTGNGSTVSFLVPQSCAFPSFSARVSA